MEYQQPYSTICYTMSGFRKEECVLDVILKGEKYVNGWFGKSTHAIVVE
jgi:hypothetical protein